MENIKYIRNPTEKVMINAISTDIKFIVFCLTYSEKVRNYLIDFYKLKEKSEKEINEFFHKEKLFRFTKNPSPELCLKELKKRKGSKKYIAKEMIENFKKLLQEGTTEEKNIIMKIKYLAPELFS